VDLVATDADPIFGDLDHDITLVAPSRSPRVSHNPVGLLVCDPVPNEENCVVQHQICLVSYAAVVIKNSG
jgi:hypothetical protein